MARLERSELVDLFLRVAGTLEQSADLADAHADRDERNGLSGEVEQQAAARARQAAARARTVANGW